ncbi:MAG: hypothetical protein ACE5LL_03270 [Alphaproteobacteria bacterium]
MRAPIRAVAILAAGLVLLLFASAANAQQLCLLRGDAVGQLENKFKEQVVGRGLAQGGRAMVELFVGETGTWTVVVTDVNGQSCIVASGESWTQAPLLVGDPA